MGNALRRVTTRFNVENRAHRAIESKSLRRTPTYPSTKKEIERFRQKFPEGVDQKNESLAKMLQQVKVDSTDVPGESFGIKVNEQVASRDQSLPKSRHVSSGPSVLLSDEVVPTGKISVPKALELLAKHQLNSKTFSAEKLSKDFQLELQDTQNILDYFQAFRLAPLNPNEPNVKLPMDYQRKEVDKVQ